MFSEGVLLKSNLKEAHVYGIDLHFIIRIERGFFLRLMFFLKHLDLMTILNFASLTYSQLDRQVTYSQVRLLCFHIPSPSIIIFQEEGPYSI